MTTNTQKVLWTALPNGLAGSPPTLTSGLQLSAYVSPQLMSDPSITNPTLALFPDFLDWPATVAKMKFSVQFSNGQKVTATPMLTGPTAPNSSLWKALFPSTTFVRPYAFNDYSNQFVYSFSVLNLLAFIKRQYQQVGAGVTGQLLARISGPASTPGTLQAFLDTALTIPQTSLQTEILKLVQTYSSQHYIPSSTPNVRQDFLEARWFFHMPQGLPRPPITVPVIDFHQAVSAVGEYPGILRMLGLVIDLKIPYSSSLPTSGPPNVQLIPTWTPSRSVVGSNISPKTVFSLNPTTFAAAPRGTEIANRMLNLANPVNGYSLMQIDLDGAIHKATNLAFALQQQLVTSSTDTPTTSGLATLRSAGISLIKSGRAQSLVQQFQQSTALRNSSLSATSTLLYSEDVTRGHTVDVQTIAGTTPGPWYSLMRRIGTYTFPTAPPSLQAITIHDEGSFSLAPTRKPDVGPEFYVSEAMFHWENWSLSAPRPGTALDENGKPVRVQNTIQTPFQIAANFTVEPGTLPVLRFGRKYRVRARVVDLAGNVLPYTTADSSEALPDAANPFVYRRFEPVNAPEVVLHDPIFTPTNTPLSPGEAVRRMVVRSDHGKTNADWVSYANALLGTNTMLVSSARHIAPPRISQEMAEIHGMFDVPAPTPGDPNAIRPDPAAFPEIVKYNDASSGGGKFLSDVYHLDQLQLPYFADVFARGAFFTGLPGAGGNPVTQAFDGTWPAVLPFQVVLQGIPDGSLPASPAWDAAHRVLTVQLAQGETTTVNLSSYLSKDDLQLMGINQWITEYIAQKGIVSQFWNLVINSTIQGLHWMMTPFREIALVHAVQRPLQSPDFSSAFIATGIAGLVRSAGQTFVTFDENMPISKKSTNKLDVYATWTDTIDDGVNTLGSSQVQGHAHAFQVPVDPPTGPTDTTQRIDQKHQFGDTRHRTVVYNAVAASRFKEYFPDAVTNSAEGIALAGAVATKNVLSSARPDAPQVRYIVPAFEWTNSNPPSGPETITRAGRRLRVYLERPWYSSGQGELLAAVMLTGDFTPDSVQSSIRIQLEKVRRFGPHVTAPGWADIQPFVTQWGNDPILGQNNGETRLPRATDFGLAPTLSNAPVQIPELLGTDLEVAAYPVQFDTDRQLWYADMELVTGDIYYPFIRLALARYQPDALAGLQLSKVVLADFAQLAADRTASITFSDPNHAHVSVVGPSALIDPGGRNVLSTQMRVVVEQQGDNLGASTSSDDDFGWVPDSNYVPIVLVASAASGSVTWSGDIDLTQTPNRPLRLVIREQEVYASDPSTLTQSPNIFDQDMSTRLARTVYAAVINVS